MVNSSGCLFSELYMFDPSKPVASIPTQISVAVCIVLLTAVLYNILLKIPALQAKNEVGSGESTSMYSTLKKNGVSSGSYVAAVILNGSLYGPIAEEITFRFLLMKVFLVRKLGLNVHAANAIQALFSGFLHMTNTAFSAQGQNLSALQSIYSTILFAICGYSYIYTNSILPAIMAHMINNLWSASFDLKNYSAYLESHPSRK